jgi:uncharacterized membrane protein YphA (DoxX/SURF4 family)
LSQVHRRDRTALVLIRLTYGALALEAGIRLLRSGWGDPELSALLLARAAQPVIAPSVAVTLTNLSTVATPLAAAVIAVHLLGGTLLLMGVLSRSAALGLGILYSGYCLAGPSAAGLLLAVVGLSLAISDAGRHFSLQPGRSTTATHQGTSTV